MIKNIHQVPIFHIFIYLFVHFLSKQMESKENNDNPCVNNEGERGKYRALEARAWSEAEHSSVNKNYKRGETERNFVGL